MTGKTYHMDHFYSGNLLKDRSHYFVIQKQYFKTWQALTLIQRHKQAYLEPSRTSKMDLLAKIING